jgi:F-type H+-transporting ATPase subunit delta
MTQTGSIYGESLYSLAAEEKVEKAILDELAVLKQSFTAEPDFIRLLGAPNVSKAERCQILDQSFRGKVHPYVLNFMKILTEKGYMRHFADCCDAYRSSYNRDHGILVVTAVSAVALNDAQQAKLMAKLASVTGKTIELVNKVDPACYGGLRISYDGKCIDDTVAHRLDAVRDLLKNTVL